MKSIIDVASRRLKPGDLIIAATNNQLYFGVVVCTVETGGINAEFHGGGLSKPLLKTIVFPSSEVYGLGDTPIPDDIGRTLYPRATQLRNAKY